MVKRWRRLTMFNSTPALIPLYKYTHLVTYALVDAKDAPALLEANWTLLSTGYAVTTAKHLFGGETYMHRVVANPVPEQVVDHINGFRLDNRKINLRGCTQAENMRNTRRIANSSGVRGAYLDKRDGKWTAAVVVDGKRFALSRFETAEEAGRAYDSAARQLHGEYAVLNWPDQPDVYPDTDWKSYAIEREATSKNQKLSLEQARQIREAAATGALFADLAREYHVVPSNIHQIVAGRSYKEPPAPAQLEEALRRIKEGQKVTRVATDMKMGRNVLNRAIRQRWGAAPPVTAHKRRANAKLTLVQVHEILARVEAGEKQIDLAAEYGVKIATINGYVRGKSRTSTP